MEATDPKPDSKIVVQHNALINARFGILPLQMRLFLALLSRIKFDDTSFKEHFIPASEIVFDRHGGSAYQQIQEMCDDITSLKLYIELLEEGTRKRQRRPKFDYIPLMAKAGYDGERGGVVAAFNPIIMPYLLQLQESGNFTMAELAELRKLKSPNSVRFYWLLKEYADFGNRTLSLQQLRYMLDIAEHEYPRFSNFKARILDPAQNELAGTDIPFTYELKRANQKVKDIKFLFGQRIPDDTQALCVNPVDTGLISSESINKTENTQHSENIEYSTLISTLRSVGVSQRSISRIVDQLNAQEYAIGYVDFVLSRIGKQHQLGKVKKPAGAIYKALVEKYLLAEYKLELAKPVVKPQKKLLASTSQLSAEVAFPMREIREMYDNPGPFLKRQLGGQSFEQYLQITYLEQGFEVELRTGENWVVKR
ncbi:replication initiation protein (plasmid) [Hymenobacter sp. BRD128]|uniref:replication initiation protein n=1 Tax=Hymenobacter sp. BRD128 TaxID=2675878 RepID=UPI001565B363|nr:replication initiation protein [Hymenobacter sp. BRD128]QKG59175.1 replication initiation protein [Hymenobacter sp. BRD128]